MFKLKNILNKNYLYIAILSLFIVLVYIQLNSGVVENFNIEKVNIDGLIIGLDQIEECYQFKDNKHCGDPLITKNFIQLRDRMG